MSRKRRRARRTAIGVGVSVGATIGIAPTAQALDYEVDNLGDSNVATTCDAGADNDCSLRQALINSNASGAVDDVIVFESGLSGSINVTAALTIFDSVQINGPGASVLSMDMNDTGRHFYLAPAADVVGISGLTLTDGDAASSVSDGGSIYNVGTDNSLTITGAAITESQGQEGGAIYSYGPVAIIDSQVTGNTATTGSGGGILLQATAADLTVEGSVISGNKSPGSFGGGINAPSGSDVSIDGSTLSQNEARSGGGVRVQYGELTITDSTVSGNKATDFDGGGIRIDQTEATISRSTVSGNTAFSQGGGISIDDASVEILSTTVSGNRATNEGAQGGGINIRASASNDLITISDSTVASNSATQGGGGNFDDLGTPPSPLLSNTIVADNSASTGPNLSHGWRADFSLIESAAGAAITATVPGSNITGKDPKLGPLADNGGATATRRPLAGSPVIDRGSTAASADQRGRPRPLNIPSIANSPASGADGADIGAVELARNEIPACGGRPATIAATGRRVTGTAGPDVIVGTAKANVIRGRGGRDVICGLPGNDRLVGGGGRDTLIGGKGRDTLKGGPGRDKLKGGPGRDVQRQ